MIRPKKVEELIANYRKLRDNCAIGGEVKLNRLDVDSIVSYILDLEARTAESEKAYQQIKNLEKDLFSLKTKLKVISNLAAVLDEENSND